MKRIALVFAFAFIASIGFSQVEATTKDGKKVLLDASGTWKYQEESKPETASKTSDNFDFRQANWGMSKAEVKKTEKEPPAKESEKTLLFSDELDGLNCLVAYIFFNDQLSRGKYIVVEEHTDPNMFIHNYESLQKLLKEKYGKPSSQDELWLNNLYKKDRQNWGMAVSAGHLALYSEWKKGKTIINLALNGDNFKTTLVIEYAGEEYAEKEAKGQKEKAKGKL